MDALANHPIAPPAPHALIARLSRLRLLSAFTLPVTWAAPTVTALCTGSVLCTGIAYLLSLLAWWRLRTINWDNAAIERLKAWREGYTAGRREIIERQIGQLESAIMQNQAHQARSVGD